MEDALRYPIGEFDSHQMITAQKAEGQVSNYHQKEAVQEARVRPLNRHI
jgi:hypothetical protein